MLTYNNSLHKITLQFGVTALHLARNAKVAELLIENGAKIELISNVRGGGGGWGWGGGCSSTPPPPRA